MPYYPHRNGQIYIESQPLWDYYTHLPNKSWHREPFEPIHTINHWRDLDGARMSQISKKDLQFKNWYRTRIRESACLPLYYTTGYRFIRITRDFPAGFKCPPLPMNLAEAYAEKTHSRKLQREAERLAKKTAKTQMNMAKNDIKKMNK
ncbi:uncharacterized protein LOC142239683 [Haematobia irritans]|uniref:uncharacterized protein LOC142239683 n=1 Tax=Haematobia irritans TaxID=7368 RepID=UPI003F4F5317